jgi:hypothetical protein
LGFIALFRGLKSSPDALGKCNGCDHESNQKRMANTDEISINETLLNQPRISGAEEEQRAASSLREQQLDAENPERNANPVGDTLTQMKTAAANAGKAGAGPAGESSGC